MSKGGIFGDAGARLVEDFGDVVDVEVRKKELSAFKCMDTSHPSDVEKCNANGSKLSVTKRAITQIIVKVVAQIVTVLLLKIVFRASLQSAVGQLP